MAIEIEPTYPVYGFYFYLGEETTFLPIRIGICDDRAEDARALSDALYAYDPSFQISIYADGQSLLEDCYDPKALFDIVFLDIYMPGLSGIETAKALRTCLKDAKIIFISSSDGHYPEAFDVFAFNYLLKPLDRTKLNRILQQALIDINGERLQQISFSYKGIMYRLFCRDILYIESRDKTIYFHMADKKTLLCYAQLDEMIKKLPEESFIRCHQSFVVNVLHVSQMAEQHFRLDPAVISISKKYREAAREKYFAYLFTHMR